METDRVAQITEQVMTVLATYGLRVIGAILILIVGRIVAGILAGAIRKAMTRSEIDPSLIGFVASLVRTGIMLFAVLAALKKFGVETTGFVAVLGAAGFAIGFAMQGSLSNFASGVMILIFKPFSVGDVIDAAGSKGKVASIGIFTTIMTTPDNQKIIVPNASVMGGTITNVNAFDTRRVDMTAGIGYDDDIGQAKQVLENIVNQHPLVLKDPEPTIQVVELADSSVNFVVRPWVNTADYWTVYFDVTRSIKEEFDKAGLSIPYPQQDVHMHQAS